MKIVLKIVVVLIVLLVVVLIAGQIIVNRPFVREKITKTLSEKLQRDISLSGMSLSVFPSVGVSLNEFKISEKDKTATFASLEKLSVKVDLFPLFKKQVVVREVILSSPKINIEKNAQGQFNFSDLLGAQAPAAPDAKAPEPAAEAGVAPKIEVETIRIKEAEIIYKETLPTGESRVFDIKGLNLAVDDFSMTRPVAIDFSCDFGAQAQVRVKGRVGPISAPPDKMEADVKLGVKGFSDSDIAPFIPAGALGQMGFENLTVQGQVKGSLAANLAADLTISLKLLPDRKDVQFKTVLDLQGGKSLILKELALAFGQKIRLNAKGSVSPLMAQSVDAMNLDFDWEFTGLTGAELAPYLGQDALQGLDFNNFSFKGMIKGNPGRHIDVTSGLAMKLLPDNKDVTLDAALILRGKDEIVLDKLALKFGSSDLMLRGNLKGAATQPTGALDISSNLIDVKDFMLKTAGKAPVPETKPAPAQKAPASAQAPENPLYGNEMFQKAQFNIVVALKKIVYEQNVLQDLSFSVGVRQGVIALRDFTLSLFSGKITGQSQLDLRGQKIGFDGAFNVSGLSLEQATAANLGEEKLQGTLNAKSSFKGSGLSRPDLERSLSAASNIQIEEGKMIGSNLKADILEKMDNPVLLQFLPGLAKMREEAMAETVKETPFRDFVVDADVSAGTAQLRSLSLATDDFSLKGSGSADFSLQGNLGAQVVFSKEFTEKMTAGKDYSNMLPYEGGGLLVPVKVMGNLAKPVVLPDLAVILQSIAKGQVKEKVGGVLKEKAKEFAPLEQLLGTPQTQPQPSEGQAPAPQPKKSPLDMLFGEGQQQTQTQQQPQQQEQEDASPLDRFKKLF